MVPLHFLAAIALLSVAGASSAVAQDCASGIERLEAFLQSDNAAESMPGPSRQIGSAADEQPQAAVPDLSDADLSEDAAEEGSASGGYGPRASAAEGSASKDQDVAEEQPQSGNPADDGAPSRRPSAVAEQQPQFGNPEEEQESDRSTGERRQLVELRDQAQQALAQGNQQECMAAVREAETLIGSDQAVQD